MRAQGQCSTCGDGPCAAGLACEQPLPEVLPISRRLFAKQRLLTPEVWARVIGAALGLSAAGALAHHFHLI